MSTKKTGAVHTITAEQKAKMDKLGDIRSRLAAEEWVEACGRRGLPHDCSAAFIERALAH